MPDDGSERRALDAISDLVDALRIAQSAARRVENELYGAAFDQAHGVIGEVHEARRLAERLRTLVEREFGTPRVSLPTSGNARTGPPS